MFDLALEKNEFARRFLGFAENHICSGVATQEFKKNDVIYREGDEADSFFIIMDGNVDIIKDHDGSRFVVTQSSQYDVVGEIAMFFDDRIRTTTVIATSALKVVTVSYSGFIDICSTSPEYLFCITKMLANRLSGTTSKVDALATLDVKGKIVYLLNEKYKALSEGESLDVRFKLSKKHISEQVGCSRELAGQKFNEILSENKDVISKSANMHIDMKGLISR